MPSSRSSGPKRPTPDKARPGAGSRPLVESSEQPLLAFTVESRAPPGNDRDSNSANARPQDNPPFVRIHHPIVRLHEPGCSERDDSDGSCRVGPESSASSPTNLNEVALGLFSYIFRRSKKRPPTPAEPPDFSGPEGEEQLSAAVRIARDAGQREVALDLLDQGSELFPDNLEFLAERQSLEHEMAYEAIELALTRIEKSDDAETRAELAELYRQVGERDLAIEWGRSSIDLNPDLAAGYRAVGRVYFEQFQSTENSIAGMHALRYLSKAHSLAPTSSLCILKLAEIFVILKAPRAAERFLAPVRKAFESDPWVQCLADRIAELPDEETTQIQDLFLRHEKRVNGEAATPATGAAVSPESLTRLDEAVGSLSGVSGYCVVGPERRAVHAKGQLDGHDEETEEKLGLLAETLRTCSVRMGIGDFKSLSAVYPGQVLMVEPHEPGFDLVLVGDGSMPPQQIEVVLDRLRDPQGIDGQVSAS